MAFTTNVYQGIALNNNTISIDNGLTKNIPESAIQEFKDRNFDTISIEHKRSTLGSILDDIAENFKAPKTLNLDLFRDGSLYVFDNLEESESTVKNTFSKWTGSDCNVFFRCGHTIIREFKL